MDEFLLTVDKISFSYAKDPVFSDVSFTVKAGEIVFLHGGNGAGKSTLLKCLAGWLRPSSGEIGFACEGKRGGLMLVNDVPAFYDDLTAQEHVSLLLRAGSLEGREEYVGALLEEVGLGRRLGQHPSTFSRGMRLKLALVLALAVRPKLLLLDEPYGALDAEASAVLDREIVRLCGEGSSVIASCHSRSPGISPDATLLLEGGVSAVSDLVRDISTLVKLRARHAWVEFARWFHVAGSDPITDTSATDRLYQLYVVLLVIAALFLIWLSALDYATTAGATLGADTCSRIADLLWVVPAAAFALLLVRHLRSCPVRMTHPDILWLSPNLDPMSWALSELAFELLLALASGALTGFAIGTALQAAVSPYVVSMLIAAAVAAAVALSWALGMMRHLAPGWPPMIDVHSLVRANALYADLQPLRAWAAHAPAAYEEARRRRLIASRRPFLELPDLRGWRLLVARSSLSLVRQREGVPKLATWGVLVIPLGAIAAASSPPIWTVLAWVAVAASLIPASREMTRVFSDDARVRIVGDLIDLPRFKLLLVDSLPATALVVVVSSLAIAVAIAAGLAPVNAPAAFFVGLSLTATLLFAGGIDPAVHGTVHGGPAYDIIVLGHLALVAISSLVNPVLAASGGCAFAAFLGTMCHRALRLR